MSSAASDTFVIDTPEQLRALSDPLRQRLPGAFAHGATVKAVAVRLGEPTTKLYHHVDQLLAAGLIRVIGEAKRRSLTERTFQAAASRFAVSPAAIGAGGEASERERIARAALEEMLAGAAAGAGSLRLMRSRVRLSAAGLERIESELARLLAELEEAEAPEVEVALLAVRQR